MRDHEDDDHLDEDEGPPPTWRQRMRSWWTYKRYRLGYWWRHRVLRRPKPPTNPWDEVLKQHYTADHVKEMAADRTPLSKLVKAPADRDIKPDNTTDIE